MLTTPSRSRRRLARWTLVVAALLTLWWLFHHQSSPTGRHLATTRTLPAAATPVRFGTPEMQARVRAMSKEWGRTLSQMPRFAVSRAPQVAIVATLTEAEMDLLARGETLTLERMTPEHRALAREFEPLPWIERQYRFKRVTLARIETFTSKRDAPCYSIIIRDLDSGREVNILTGRF